MSEKNIKKIISSIKSLITVNSNIDCAGDASPVAQCSKDEDVYQCHCHTNKDSLLSKTLEYRLKNIGDSFQEEGNERLLRNALDICKCRHDDMVMCSKDFELIFLNKCFELLSILQKEIEKEIRNRHELGPNLIGVQDQKVVHGVIEMILGIGICPNMLEGIGLPFKNKNTSSKKRKTEPRKLFHCIRILLDILKNKLLNAIIYPLVISDLLGSLVQLVYCPMKKSEEITGPCCCNNDAKSCYTCGCLCQHEREWCSQQLQILLNRSHQPLIVKHLLMLQRCSTGGVRPKYSWFLKQVGNLLSKCILRESGVKSVMLGILEGCDIDSMDWKRYQSIGKIIAHVPMQVASADLYFQTISPQINALLREEPTKENYPFSTIAISIANSVLRKYPDLFEKYIFLPLFEELICLGDPDFQSKCLNENALKKVLVVFEKMHSYQAVLSNTIWERLFQFYPTLFFIYCSFDSSVLIERKQIYEMLKFLLSKSEISLSINSLDCCLFGNSINSTLDIPYPILTTEKVHFYHLKDTMAMDDISTEQKVSIILDLLKSVEFEELREQYFVNLLSILVDVLQKQESQEDEKSMLLQLDNKISHIKFKIQLLSIISGMMDEFGCSVVKSTPQMVTFVKHIFDLNSCIDMSNYENLSFCQDDENSETVDLALMLLSTLFGTGKLTDSDYNEMSTLIPALERVSKNHKNESSQNLANDLKTFIVTHGFVKPDENIKINTSNEERHDSDLYSEEAYKKALKDLLDPLLPTRGHALITLTKLLKKRNEYALNDQDKLLDIFEANLNSHDTYLYLQSIEGLLALVDVHHQKILPTLCKKFSQLYSKEGQKESVSCELRMKLCESIVKSCHLCNEVLPSYTDILLSSLLSGLKDNESFIRASSMSAIGDVCHLLKYSVGRFITEILSCIKHIVTTEKSVEVRRASIQVFTLLFEGQGSKMIQTLPDELLEIYRLLKMLLQKEKDELTILHISNALNIMDENVKEELFKKTSFEKKIQILT